MKNFKRILVLTLIIQLVLSMIPKLNTDVSYASGYTFKHSEHLINSKNGKQYQTAESEPKMVTKWVPDYDELELVKKTYSFTSDSIKFTKYRMNGKLVYCIESGVPINDSIMYRKVDYKKSHMYQVYVKKGKKYAFDNIAKVMMYAIQDGVTMEDLKRPITEGGLGFVEWRKAQGDSGFAYKISQIDRYTPDDWETAGREIVHECQQLIRDPNFNRVDNGLVSPYHHYKGIEGTPAGDLYRFMVSKAISFPTAFSHRLFKADSDEIKEKDVIELSDPDNDNVWESKEFKVSERNAYQMLVLKGKKVSTPVDKNIKIELNKKADGNYYYKVVYKCSKGKKPNVEKVFTAVREFDTTKASKQEMFVYEGYSGGRIVNTQAVSSGAVDPLPLFLKFKIKDGDGGKITLHKVGDNGSALKGAKFELWSMKEENGKMVPSELVKKATSDKDGLVVFDDLKFGIYAFKEVKAPSGYTILFKGFSTPIEISKDKRQVDIAKKIVNKHKDEPKGFVIEKITDDGEVLAGAKFQLYGSKMENGVLVKDETKKINDKTGTNITGEDGRLRYGELPEGTYFYEELVAPKGFERIDKVFKVEIKAGQSSAQIVQVTNRKKKERKPKEPEYFPMIEIPIEKIDKNTGFDGDNHTPMGDAHLGAKYELYKNGVKIQELTLDELGHKQVFQDKPYELSDLVKRESGSKTHKKDGHTCEVSPTHIDWDGSKITYEVREVRPEGRFIESDKGFRKYEITYHAECDNEQECVDEDEQWTDIIYTLTYQTTEGTNKTPVTTVTGAYDTVRIVDPIIYNPETFVNDNFRGKITLSKSLEEYDIFSKDKGLGGKEDSVKSLWRIKLNSGGYENHPYLRYVKEKSLVDGTAVYRVVRDNSGVSSETEFMQIGTNGDMVVYDIPYGKYTVEEVSADKTHFVLETFQVNIEEYDYVGITYLDAKNTPYSEDGKYDNRYDYNVRDKIKDNRIKIIKTNAETGKQVTEQLSKGTKLYLRYLGSPLLTDEENKKLKNYGRLLPNSSDITDDGPYTFELDKNGEFTIHYRLPYGIYRAEEWLVPHGYFVGEYDSTGKAKNHDYGKVEENQVKALRPHDYDSIVTIFDREGNPVKYKNKKEYKVSEISNFYTFYVTEQDVHNDGNYGQKVDYKGNITKADKNYDIKNYPFTDYYKAVAMANNNVKGKIKVEKKGQALVGFTTKKIDGRTVYIPKYEMRTLKCAKFGIYANEDILLNDGSKMPEIYSKVTNKKIELNVDEITHEKSSTFKEWSFFKNIKLKAKKFLTGLTKLDEGGYIFNFLEREDSERNKSTTIYVTPENKDSSYEYEFIKKDKDVTNKYKVNVVMNYQAGGKNVTKFRIEKDITPDKLKAEINKTTPKIKINGEKDFREIEKWTNDSSTPSLFSYSYESFNYEANGKSGKDQNGNEVDFGKIGEKRLVDKIYEPYVLSVYDVMPNTKTEFEWQNFGFSDFDKLINPKANKKAVKENTEGTYLYVLKKTWTDNNSDGNQSSDEIQEELTWITSDKDGNYDLTRYPSTITASGTSSYTPKLLTDDDVKISKKLKYEWENKVELNNPVKNGKAVHSLGNGNYELKTIGYYEKGEYIEAENTVKCDSNGNPIPSYEIPNGYTLVEWNKNKEIDTKYIIIKKENEPLYKVLLNDNTWQDSDENGNFIEKIVEVYEGNYVQMEDFDEGFTLEFDGFILSSKVDQAKKEAKTVITKQSNSIKAKIEVGIGTVRELDKENPLNDIFTQREPDSKIYFLNSLGIRTEMYYAGGVMKATLKIPRDAVKKYFKNISPTLWVLPALNSTEYEELDWYTKLSPNNPEVTGKTIGGVEWKATRVDNDKPDSPEDYVLEIISNQKEGKPMKIKFADGYTFTFFNSESENGNGVGVILIEAEYKTQREGLSKLVDVIETDDKGVAYSKNLNLGKYTVRELEAPDYYTGSKKKEYVELKYKDQFTPVVFESREVGNNYVVTELELIKAFEKDFNTNDFIKDKGAKFGIFTADNIKYQGGELPKDSLLKIFDVTEGGRTLEKVRLPKGRYYVLELETKGTHMLNTHKYFFEVSDEIKRADNEFIISDEDSGFDVMTYLNGEDELIFKLFVLHRFPFSNIKVGEESFTLDKNYSKNNLDISYDKDKIVVTVKLDKLNPDAKVTLPNGKVLSLSVKGSEYEYALEGAKPTKVKTAVGKTGYEGEYLYSENEAEDIYGKLILTTENPDKTITLTKKGSGELKRNITVNSINHRSGIVANISYKVKEKEIDDPNNISGKKLVVATDSNGKAVIERTIKIQGEAGTEFVSGVRKDKLIPVDELEGEMVLNSYEGLTLRTSDNEIWEVIADSDGDILFRVLSILEGTYPSANNISGKYEVILTNELGTDERLNGEIKVTKNETLRRKFNNLEDFLMIKLNSENGLSSEIKNFHKPYILKTEKGSMKLVPNAVIGIYEDEKLTKLVERVISDNEGKAYLNVKKAGTYYFKEISAPTGYVLNEEVYSFTVKLDNTVIGVLKLENELGIVPTPNVPTPLKPSIRTMAKDIFTNSNTGYAGKNSGIVDTIMYFNFDSNKYYVNKGVLMDKATSKPILINGKEVTVTKVFKPSTLNGNTDVTFTFDVRSVKGKDLVVFEKVYEITKVIDFVDNNGNGKFDEGDEPKTYEVSEYPIATHEDITDEGQTVRYPEDDKPKNPQEPPTLKEKTPPTDSPVPQTGGNMNYDFDIILIVLCTLLLIIEKCLTRAKK